MKKVLALVLAVMMLATVAFAAVTPGNGTTAGSALPGDTITLDATMFYLNGDGTSTQLDNTVTFTSEYFSISRKVFESGSSLVESVAFNDDDAVIEIKLKQDYDLKAPTKANLVLDELDIKCKKDTGVADKGKTYKLNSYAEGSTWVSWVVGYAENTIGTGLSAGDEILNANFTDINKVDKDLAYGVLTFDAMDTDVNVSVRVFAKETYNLAQSTKVDSAILVANADADADITGLNFKAAPTFNSTATVYFYKPEDSFIYEVKNGKLVDCNAKWSEDDGAFVLKTRTLGSYVFSDVELDAASEDESVENPDTGANDVVGIAAALGAVALVSAAAVSLKK